MRDVDVRHRAFIEQGCHQSEIDAGVRAGPAALHGGAT